MTAERFSFYIQNPAHLYQITYTELKSLVLLYPYCQNLRYLLLKKSILENHKESDQNLQLAATYSVDRTFLYKQIKEGDAYVSEADSFLLKKDFLELKELHPNSDPSNAEEYEAYSDLFEPAIESGGSSSDNILKTSMEASDSRASLKNEAPEDNTETNEPQEETSNFLENIDEDELVDITDEMEDLFEVEADSIKEEKPISTEQEENEQIETTENLVVDEAISIEELIELDSLSPLERLEKIKARQKESQKEGMNRKTADFEEMDALIEKTKKNVSLEITNQDTLKMKQEIAQQPSPKTTFGSWLKQFQANEEKVKSEATLDASESKMDTAIPEKPAKKKKKPAKAKKAKKKTVKKKEKKMAKIEEKPVEKVPEKAKVIAEKSLSLKSEVVSETLAKLLVKQENYSEAIKMYEKLILIFPEKSGFFAEQIKKLKKFIT